MAQHENWRRLDHGLPAQAYGHVMVTRRTIIDRMQVLIQRIELVANLADSMRAILRQDPDASWRYLNDQEKEELRNGKR